MFASSLFTTLVSNISYKSITHSFHTIKASHCAAMANLRLMKCISKFSNEASIYIATKDRILATH